MDQQDKRLTTEFTPTLDKALPDTTRTDILITPTSSNTMDHHQAGASEI